MSRELKERLKKAREYQKRAILELLPEGMEGHLEVIGKELRLMAEETLGRAVMGCMGNLGTEEESGNAKKVNKVEIR